MLIAFLNNGSTIKKYILWYFLWYNMLSKLIDPSTNEKVNFMEDEKKGVDRFDWTLAFILFLFLVVSLIAISSAQTHGQYVGNFVFQQVVWYGVGAFIIAFAMLFEPDQYKKLSWILYGFGIFILVFLHFAPESIAEPRNGAKSWFTIPKVGTIQPSEFMKIFLILALSRVISDHHQNYKLKTLKTEFWLLGKLILTTLLPLGMIMLQPDLGTGLVVIAIAAGMMLVSGITWKIIVPVFSVIMSVGAAIILIMIYFPEWVESYIPQYQLARIYSWLDPYSYSSHEGYQLVTSLQAIGSGEIFGKGYMGKEVYVSDRHTDFVFSTIGEEFGFIGASVVICLFFLLIYHLIKVALEANSPFDSYVCAGIITMTTFHVFQNIGMTIQLLPITGIPLPFVSYGGSSLMGNMLAMGIIFSIKFYHKKYMFSTNTED